MTGKKASTKQTETKKEETKSEEPVVPQLTFTEEEHKHLVEYMNFVNNNARFNDIGLKQIHEFSVVNVKAINVVKKIEGYIFEFRKSQMTKPPQGSN